MSSIRERKGNNKAEKNKPGPNRKDSDKGGVCVYQAGVCQRGQRAKRSFASVHFY